MSITAGVLGMSQSDGSVETLTTEEAMHALFPQRVIDEAKQVAGSSHSNGSPPIAKDASRKPAL